MFKSLEIKKGSLEKLHGEQGELMRSDVEGQVKGLTPGEWILLRDPHRRRVFLGFANPLIEERLPAINVVTRLSVAPTANVVEEYLTSKLAQAWALRNSFGDYPQGCRAIYGQADGLPGLVVDVYRDCALVQVNSAGMERWRAFLRAQLQELIGKPCHFLDNPAQRSREVLPHHREELPFSELAVVENGFDYRIPAKNLQKVGWYYDHRENRRKLESALGRWQGRKEKGVDLFCYGGAWGCHALRAGVKSVDFIDQAPLAEMIERHLELNGFAGRGKFQRADVFDWLDKAIEKKTTYDVVISDPPAFAKSPKEKSAAIESYKKLHRKVLQLTNAHGLIAFASCTHYVDQAEFMDSIAYAARQEHRPIQILETGMQGWDHPVAHPADRANYIKYVLVRA